MSNAQSDAALPAELEMIASAAHDRLHAQAGQDLYLPRGAYDRPRSRPKTFLACS
jgi:hypothetical protein